MSLRRNVRRLALRQHVNPAHLEQGIFLSYMLFVSVHPPAVRLRWLHTRPMLPRRPHHKRGESLLISLLWLWLAAGCPMILLMRNFWTWMAASLRPTRLASFQDYYRVGPCLIGSFSMFRQPKFQILLLKALDKWMGPVMMSLVILS